MNMVEQIASSVVMTSVLNAEGYRSTIRSAEVVIPKIQMTQIQVILMDMMVQTILCLSQDSILSPALNICVGVAYGVLFVENTRVVHGNGSSISVLRNPWTS